MEYTVKSCVYNTFSQPKLDQKWVMVLYIGPGTKFNPIFFGYRGSMTADIACYASCLTVNKSNLSEIPYS